MRRVLHMLEGGGVAMTKVRVRRDRPTALSWAVALAVTMLAVYLITLSVAPKEDAAESAAVQGERVTLEATLEGVEMYFADLGCHSDAGEARIAAARLAQRGAAGVVWSDAAGSHVLGAAYALEADAERIAARLAERESLEADVLRLSAGPVTLRITAAEADAEAVVQADRTLRMQLAQTAGMALQVDRGELPAASARTLAAVSASELDSAHRALSAIPGGADDPVCEGLSAQLEALSESLRALSKGRDSGAALSGRLRCCHVAGVLSLIELLSDLNAGG